MRYINRELKGCVGYIRKQRMFELIKTLILFAMALGIFFIGLATLHTKKSLWSVLAVLALLPACRSLVGFIMFARFDSLSEDECKCLVPPCEQKSAIFENIITTSDKTYFVPAICCIGGNVIAYAEKGTDKEGKLKEHLMTVCKNAGYDISVKIFEDQTAFSSRIIEASDKLESDTRDEHIIEVIRSVSL